MKKSALRIIALVTVLIYSAITISSLAAFAAKRDIVVRAGSVECTGECASCGCSLERTLLKTCCCWQKRQSNHCKQSTQPPECGMETETDANSPILTACSCGNKITNDFWGEDDFQLLADHSAAALFLTGKPLAGQAPQSLTSRYRDPPDKPPELPGHC